MIRSRDGTELFWYPRRMAPMVELFDPLVLNRFAAGHAPAPHGFDFMFGFGPAAGWAAMVFVATLLLAFASAELVEVDPTAHPQDKAQLLTILSRAGVPVVQVQPADVASARHVGANLARLGMYSGLVGLSSLLELAILVAWLFP